MKTKKHKDIRSMQSRGLKNTKNHEKIIEEKKNNRIYNIIFKLFIVYIKRYPTKNELNIHRNRFINIHSNSIKLAINEFKNCIEAKNNIHAPVLKVTKINDEIKKILNEKIKNENKRIVDPFFNIISNENSEHLNNVLIRHHHNIINNFTSFNPIICVKNNKIISKSNSYLVGNELRWYHDKYHEIYYRIYENIKKNYNIIITTNSPDYVINDKCIYLGNAFLDSNIGHACSYIFSILEKYDDIDKQTKFVITDNTLPNIIKLLLIFIDESQIIKLENGKLYHFNDITIHNMTHINILSIEKYTKCINKVMSSELVQCHQNQNLENKKILIIKIGKNNPYSYCNSIVMTQEMYDYVNSKNVMIIYPENICIYKLIYLLNNAKIIVTSPGAISYNHMIYFNKKGKLYFVGGQYIYSNLLPFNYIKNLNLIELKKIFA